MCLVKENVNCDGFYMTLAKYQKYIWNYHSWIKYVSLDGPDIKKSDLII